MLARIAHRVRAAAAAARAVRGAAGGGRLSLGQPEESSVVVRRRRGGIASWARGWVAAHPAADRRDPPTTRGLASKAGKSKGKKKRGRNANAPPLKEAMRALLKKVHPDLFRDKPELAGAAETNDESLKVIQGILDAVTKSKSTPERGNKRLKFYVRDESVPGGVRLVPFALKTTGGDCRNLVARQLETLFEDVGVPSEFRWEAGDWENFPESVANARDWSPPRDWTPPPTAPAPSPSTSSADAKVYSAAAAAADAEEREHAAKVKAALKMNEVLFETLAAVPWIPENAEGNERLGAIVHAVIPRLEKGGWRLPRASLEAIWRGERDEDKVIDGGDAASALALAAILRLSRNFERALGAPETPRAEFWPPAPKDFPPEESGGAS